MRYTVEVVRADLYDKSDEPFALMAQRVERKVNEGSQGHRLVSAIGGYNAEGTLWRVMLIWEATENPAQ